MYTKTYNLRSVNKERKRKRMETKERLEQEIREAVRAARSENPLVPSITNVITIDFVANAQLAVGGSAAMLYLAEEGESIVPASAAFYINMGSLLPVHREGVIRTARALSCASCPWVLDPVGIGIGSMRNEILLGIKEYKPSIIRCNASEAIALARLWNLETEDVRSHVRGVDASDTVQDAKAAAISLARFTGGAVAVSGKLDLVCDAQKLAFSAGGSELMTKITGSGCSLGGVAAVYAAHATPFVAALTATAAYNRAGKNAEAKAQGPASFKTAFLDELFNLSAEEIAQNPFDLEEI